MGQQPEREMKSRELFSCFRMGETLVGYVYEKDPGGEKRYSKGRLEL